MARFPGRRLHPLALAFCVAALAITAAACGGGSSSPSSSGGGGGGSTVPSVTTGGGNGVGDSAFCSYAKEWANQLSAKVQTTFSAGISNPAKMKSGLTTLMAAYQQIVNAAPSDIKPSLAVVVNDFQKFVNIMAAHGYDYKKALPAMEAQGTNPFQNAASKQAIRKLNAWAKANKCKIS